MARRIKVREQDGQQLSTTVVEAVAEREEVEPWDLPPLFDYIDGDALDAMFRHKAPECVEFVYADYVIEVGAAGEMSGQAATGSTMRE